MTDLPDVHAPARNRLYAYTGWEDLAYALAGALTVSGDGWPDWDDAKLDAWIDKWIPYALPLLSPPRSRYPSGSSGGTLAGHGDPTKTAPRQSTVPRCQRRTASRCAVPSASVNRLGGVPVAASTAVRIALVQFR